jgi:hypothetical protein
MLACKLSWLTPSALTSGAAYHYDIPRDVLRRPQADGRGRSRFHRHH